MSKAVKDDDAEYTTTVDDRDEQIKLLQVQVRDLEDDVATLEKKLKAAESLHPQGDCVVLGGKIHKIERTVEARHATDEARKGYIDLDAELIVVKRG